MLDVSPSLFDLDSRHSALDPPWISLLLRWTLLGYCCSSSGTLRILLLLESHRFCLVLSPLAWIMSDTSRDGDSEEFWCEDGDLTDAPDNALSHTSALSREWKLRHEQFHKMGYREGITEGKKASAQDGFNAGFKQSVHAGYKWGLVRGISSVLANLSDPLKEKLMGTTDNMEKVQSLHEYAQAVSTTEALKFFYDSLQKTEQSHDHPEGDSHGCSMTNKELGFSQLDSMFKELMHLLEAPENKVKIHFDKGMIS